jgi:hypothetical protein
MDKEWSYEGSLHRYARSHIDPHPFTANQSVAAWKRIYCKAYLIRQKQFVRLPPLDVPLLHFNVAWEIVVLFKRVA